MVEDLAMGARDRGMDAVFHALAHNARRAMLRRLAGGALTVGELAEPLAMSLAAASKHVHVLERAGLLRRTVDGRRHVCRLRVAPLAEADAWLRWYEPFWTGRLDALERLFREPGPARKDPKISNAPEARMTRSTAPHHVVRLERTIPAPPAQVYRAWLDPELLQRWMAPGSMTMTRAEVEEWPGGYYRIWQEDSGRDVGGFEAELLELVPDERLVFRWGFVGPQRTAGPVFDSQLTVTFQEDPAGSTLLSLVHEQLGELGAAMPGVAENVGPGWEAALDKLAVAFAPPA